MTSLNLPLKPKEVFLKLYFAKNETQIEEVLSSYSDIFDNQANWHPLGGNESNFGVVENQQSSPIAALVEKLTNSIDAILMKRCNELGIDPKSADAPHTVDAAIERFFPDFKNWDLSTNRSKQAESIQVIADSLPKDTADTSLIIYDDGEGQHPEDFEDTFLSLLRGNKNEIHFVQGKYNMGGSGAIVFCGKKRFQLIASRRHGGSGRLGFTLIRKHPLSSTESQIKKNTWYEYFKLDNAIPSFLFPTEGMDLGLRRRKFSTGTLIKLFSYDTKGNRHIRRDMLRSLDKFLYQPALPIYMIENKERYPKDKVLSSVVFGLKRRLEKNDGYIETTFSDELIDKRIGKLKTTIYVFKVKAKGKNSTKTKDYIRNEYFKNNMSVLFSVNGQVHGHYTSEFITRTLKFNLLRDYLLIHVDCSQVNMDFRNELFMASRDRLKLGDEASYLRTKLGENLRAGQLKDFYKQRKDKISVDTTDDNSLLLDFAENLPISNELRGLLSQTFKLESASKPKKKRPSKKPEKKIVEFNPQRFPSFFKLNGVKDKNGRSIISIPLGGSKTVQFDSDVENQYFDRVEEPGDLDIALMGYTPNNQIGGDSQGSVNSLNDILSINKRSPQDGKIKIVFKPEDDVKVGDEIEIKVNLHSDGHASNEFQQIFWVKIAEPVPKQPQKIPVTEENEKLGLPELILVVENKNENDLTKKTWEEIESVGGMDYETVMIPYLEGDVLEKIYINMDSSVLKNYKSQKRNLTLEQNQLADNRYISAIYFHTLFLYVINKNKKFQISKEVEGQQNTEIDLNQYLQELFSSHYAAFLLNFGISEIMENLS